MGGQKQQRRSVKVNQLRPSDSELDLTVKVIHAKTVLKRGPVQGRFAECLVGDETGIIVFTATNDQVDLAGEGKTLALSNARIGMFRGSMRLAVDHRSGQVEVVEPASFAVKENNNLSLIEFEKFALP